MSRVARIKKINTINPIIMRGNERKNIFIGDEDRRRFLETLIRMKDKYNYIIEAYCLMDNHVHLLIDDNGNDISTIMKSINISYAYYFNKVYKRVGHLFQDRFISEIVADDKYLVAVSAYIHNNPVRAAIVEKPEEYKWSSMVEYTRNNNTDHIINSERILSLFSASYKKAIQEYYQYVRKYEKVEEIYMDIDEDMLQVKRQLSEFIENYDQGKIRLEKELTIRGVTTDDLKRQRGLRKEIMELLRKNSGLTLVEIGKLCGGYAESTVSIMLKGVK
jgi:putative transposase